MSSFNLSDWALRNRSLVLYAMLVAAVAGVYAYGKLGREEDPPFTIKTMVIRTLWPGATNTDTSPSSGTAAASSAAAASRTASASRRPSFTKPRSVLWAMLSPINFTTTG